MQFTVRSLMHGASCCLGAIILQRPVTDKIQGNAMRTAAQCACVPQVDGQAVDPMLFQLAHQTDLARFYSCQIWP